MNEQVLAETHIEKREISAENFIFIAVFLLFLGVFVHNMGLVNTVNTLMNTAYSLLVDTVLYLTAICVLMGSLSALFSEFGVVALANRLLQPFMKPLYDLPGAASIGVVTTFLSDNPAILSLANDHYFKSLFKRYQFPALTNLGTAFGMGLIVCTYMLSLSVFSGVSYGAAVGMGLLGAVIGSIVSTRLMLRFTAKLFGKEEDMVPHPPQQTTSAHTRPIRTGGIGNRFMGALLDGGSAGVQMGLSIIPGVLIICTFVMMLTNSPGEGGVYTGAAYEGIGLLPALAEQFSFALEPLFGFSCPEAIGVPIIALGAAGAATSLAGQLVIAGAVDAGDIAVFTAMCMCWSGYLSTHVSMMNSLNCKQLINKAILSHTIGGLCAGVAAHWLYDALTLFL